MLQKALKSNFWPISCWFLLERPVPSQFFWKNTAFIIKWISWADRSSTFKMAFLVVFSRVLNDVFKFCKIIFHLHLLLLKTIICFMCITQNSWKIFQYSQILIFFKNSPWNIKFSYIFRLSPLCVNVEKWKKSWEIKLS